MPYRLSASGGEPELLFISARKRSDWVFPKGAIEAGEDAPIAAAREVCTRAPSPRCWQGKCVCLLGMVLLGRMHRC